MKSGPSIPFVLGGPLKNVPNRELSSFSVRKTGKPVANRVMPLNIQPLVSRLGLQI